MRVVRSIVPETRPVRLALVGEAPGRVEDERGIPFVGPSGNLLTSVLNRVGIPRAACYLGNVFRRRPPANQVDYFFIKKATAKKLKLESPYPAFGTKGFLRPGFEEDLLALYADLESLKPNLVVALGATALWALTGESKISAFRGAIMQSVRPPGLKVLPVYHPANIIRNHRFYPIFVADILKASFECHSPTISYPKRTIYINPTLDDLRWFYETHCKQTDLLAIDVETDYKNNILLCVNLAPSPHVAMVVPLVDRTNPSTHYWTEDQELEVFEILRQIFALPCAKVGHNFLYDITWLHAHRLLLHGEIHDTMLLHHALQPELPKDLGTLGAIYTNEHAWKAERPWAAQKEGD